jgi:Tfp pilus assembly protein PilX
MDCRSAGQRGSSLLEAVVSLLILSMMLLGASRLVVEQSQLVARARRDSQLWELADSVLERRGLAPLEIRNGACPTDQTRCELVLDPAALEGLWPDSTDCPGCRLTVILESLTGELLPDARLIRESIVVSWVDRGRRRQLTHARSRS